MIKDRKVYGNFLDISDNKENFYLLEDINQDQKTVTLYCRAKDASVYYGKARLNKDLAIKLKNALEDFIKEE